jgi:hypothetical protein
MNKESTIYQPDETAKALAKQMGIVCHKQLD